MLIPGLAPGPCWSPGTEDTGPEWAGTSGLVLPLGQGRAWVGAGWVWGQAWSHVSGLSQCGRQVLCLSGIQGQSLPKLLVLGPAG